MVVSINTARLLASVLDRGGRLDRSSGQLETEIVIIRDVAKEVVHCCEQHRMLHVLSIASGKKIILATGYSETAMHVIKSFHRVMMARWYSSWRGVHQSYPAVLPQ
jgi:hypothetical protein